MIKRTLYFGQAAYLSLRDGQLLVRLPAEERSRSIPIEDIGVLILDHQQISITHGLMNALEAHKCALITCSASHMPSGLFLPLDAHSLQSERFQTQIDATLPLKKQLWQQTVRMKIQNQARVLEKFDHHEGSMMLDTYRKEIQFNDITQREGHAAKVYFNCLFGNTFTREQENSINAGLDYGYSIFLSAVNREIVKNGYITQLGINHRNQFNQYNLGSDLVEVLRVFVDNKVASSQLQIFGKEEKYSLIELLSLDVEVDGTTFILKDAIGIYCKSVLDALTYRDPDLIRFINYEL